MAEVMVQNMRDPSQLITIVVTLRKAVIADIDPMDPKWVLEASTRETDEDGDPIEAIKKYLSNHDTLTEDINELITDLCKLVDWNDVVDTDPPELVGTWPTDGLQGVSVETEIIANIREMPPSSGIDLSSIRLKVKGFDLTDQLTITGDLRECSIRVTPGTKYKSALKKER